MVSSTPSHPSFAPWGLLTIEVPRNWVNSVAVSPDRETIASLDQYGVVTVYDAESGNQLGQINGHGNWDSYCWHVGRGEIADRSLTVFPFYRPQHPSVMHNRGALAVSPAGQSVRSV